MSDASVACPGPLRRLLLVGLLGLERARMQAERLVTQARDHLDAFGERADMLRALADYTISRRS
jgi:farnesyl diphosphate synthase